MAPSSALSMTSHSLPYRGVVRRPRCPKEPGTRMAAKPLWRNKEAVLQVLCLVVALSVWSPSPKLLVDKDRDGGL